MLQQHDDLLVLLSQFRVATVAHSDFLSYTEVREGHRFGRALLIENLTAVPAVMLAVGERERSPAA